MRSFKRSTELSACAKLPSFHRVQFSSTAQVVGSRTVCNFDDGRAETESCHAEERYPDATRLVESAPLGEVRGNNVILNEEDREKRQNGQQLDEKPTLGPAFYTAEDRNRGQRFAGPARGCHLCKGPDYMNQCPLPQKRDIQEAIRSAAGTEKKETAMIAVPGDLAGSTRKLEACYCVQCN